MTITTEISTTTIASTGFIGRWYQAVVNDDLAVLALLCALGLLASFYLMTHFPLSVEDAAFLTSWV
jgi:hypothetical protein